MKQLVCDLKKNFQINVHSSINSGQVFLWKKVDAKWYGIDGDNILVLDRKSKFDKNDKLLFNFLRIDDDFEKILEQLRQDKIVNNAVTLYPCLKIFRQNPFQCYISFIVSSMDGA